MATPPLMDLMRYHALEAHAVELERSAVTLPNDEAVEALRDALAARARMVEIARGA